MKLKDKTIVITGASDGIGRSIALRLAAEKTRLVLCGRDKSRLDTVASQCKEAGATVVTQAFDLADDTARAAAAEHIASLNPDVLINNAGVWHKSTPIHELEPATIKEVIATNLTAQLLFTSALAGDMLGRESAIINVVSSAGLQGKAGRTAYAASKFGMKGFTEALREEAFGTSMRVAAVFQSGTNTQMFAKASEDMPLQKYTDPDDLAEVIAFMLTRPAKIWLNEVRVVY